MNRVNGRYYIGMHTTWNMNDGYLGSGKVLARAIKKHGVSNFTVEILAFFDTRDELAKAEADMVTEEMVKDPQCMNIVRGGKGDWSPLAWARSKEKRDWLRVNDPAWRARLSTNQSGSMKRQYATGKRKRQPSANFTFAGHTHTEQVRRSVSQHASAREAGSGNSQYGKAWITNGPDEMKVPKERLDEYLTQGWRRGRSVGYSAQVSESLRNQKRFHFLYRTTNRVNGKCYIGVHTTRELDDQYLGSGMQIIRDVRKYGRLNLSCEVLQFFDTRAEANEARSKIGPVV